MRASTKNKTAGRAKEIKGKVKRGVARATRNPRLESEGRIEQAAGRTRRKIGEIQKVLED